VKANSVRRRLQGPRVDNVSDQKTAFSPTNPISCAESVNYACRHLRANLSSSAGRDPHSLVCVTQTQSITIHLQSHDTRKPIDADGTYTSFEAFQYQPRALVWLISMSPGSEAHNLNHAQIAFPQKPSFGPHQQVNPRVPLTICIKLVAMSTALFPGLPRMQPTP
jgi:hypothetical protein